MEKVTVYRTSDGQYFSLEQEDMAKRHQKRVDEGNARKNIFNREKESIKDHIFENLKEELIEGTERDDIEPFHLGRDGWDCKGEDNPIDKCIYSYQTHMGDDMCVYCGQPEERK